MVHQPASSDSGWSRRLTRSAFFFCALLFHLLIFLLVATWVVFKVPEVVPEPIITFLPPASKPVDPPKAPTGSVVSVVVHTPPTLITLDNASSSIQSGKMWTPHVTTDLATSLNGYEPKAPQVNGPSDGPSNIRWQAISKNMGRYRLDNPLLTGDDVTSVSAEFPVYVARYAEGDWACNLRLDGSGNIVAGSIPDLVAKIEEWSHGKIRATLVPQPLDIAGPELLDKMPPFIFFTGHKNFVLTDKEIENLRDYLNNGGAIWGDNALAGDGSRFDVAFKREMKRVVPDKDKNFVAYTADNPIYHKSFYRMEETPQGMNYYAEMPQHLDIDGIPAIIYTPNDYSDMMFMRILPGDKEVYIKDIVPPDTLYTNQGFWYRRGLFYRNFDLAKCLAVNRLGMNIVGYLLVRFDDKLQLSH